MLDLGHQITVLIETLFSFVEENRKPKIDNNLTKEDVSNDLKGQDYYDDDLSQDLSQNFNYDTQHLENCCANVDQRTQTVFFNQIEIFTDGSAKRDGIDSI